MFLEFFFDFMIFLLFLILPLNLWVEENFEWKNLQKWTNLTQKIHSSKRSIFKNPTSISCNAPFPEYYVYVFNNYKLQF